MTSQFAFIQEYLWYHAFTVFSIGMIVVLIVVHRKGSQQNLDVAKEYKEMLDPFLVKHFSEYDGEMLVESSNIVKLYPSGRESCLFAIFAFAVRKSLISLYRVSRFFPFCSTHSSSISRINSSLRFRLSMSCQFP